MALLCWRPSCSLSGVPPTLLTCTALRRLNMAVLGAPDKGPAISLRDLRALLRRNPGMRWVGGRGSRAAGGAW